MTENDFFTQVIPRLLAELNTSSLLLLGVAVMLWLQLRATNQRYIGHLENEVEELKRDKYVLTNGTGVGYPSSPPASGVKSGAVAT